MFDTEFVERFESKFEKSEEGCWIWTASVAGKGYGQMKLPKQRKQEYSHRLAYMIYKGEIPKGHDICHTCDTPRCVNPAHLFLGTRKDNLQDMKAKNRHLCGIKNGGSKLTEEQVRQIKACLASGMPQKRIGLAFGIAQGTVSKINIGERWEHLNKDGAGDGHDEH